MMPAVIRAARDRSWKKVRNESDLKMDSLKEIILSFDKSVFFFFQHLQRPWLDYFLAWPTRLGETQILLTLLIPGILLFDKKKYAQSLPAAVIAVFMATWLSPVSKAFFHRPRPHIYWEHVNVIFFKPLNDSFPSGHTAVIFSAACILGHYYPKKMCWFYLVAAWVAITRVYVGAHYPTDLVGGALLGAACAWFAWRLVAYLEQRNAQTP